MLIEFARALRNCLSLSGFSVVLGISQVVFAPRWYGAPEKYVLKLLVIADLGAKLFFKLSERYGNDIYNFRGLAFHKSKYRGTEKFLYFASNSVWPANDIYLAFRAADITRGYFSTLGKLVRGMASAKNGHKAEANGR